jgi:outer membrane receptor protein involved in Fe transport
VDTYATRENNGFYVFDQYTLARRFYLSGGVRYEHSSAYGDEFAPRGAASVLLAGEHGALSSTFLRFSAGRGITEPSLYDDYIQSPFAVGNPALKPEVTRSYEAGLVQEWLGKRLRTEVNAFRSSFDNLIAFTAANTFENIEASWAHGLEAIAQAHFGSHVRIDGSYMRVYTRITNAVDATTIGEQLPRRPLNSGSVALYITPKRWSFAAGGNFAGEMQDVDYVFGINRNPGYKNVFASASYTLNRYATLTLRGANLLNVYYQEALGYPALSRSVIGGVRLGW